jgi:hypothetical protein
LLMRGLGSGEAGGETSSSAWAVSVSTVAEGEAVRASAIVEDIFADNIAVLAVEREGIKRPLISYADMLSVLIAMKTNNSKAQRSGNINTTFVVPTRIREIKSDVDQQTSSPRRQCTTTTC